jgi:DUF1680 family protein
MDTSKFTKHISLKNIEINDVFWKTFMERIRTQVLPYQWEALNDRVPGAAPSYAMRNFKLAAEKTHPELDYGVDPAVGHGGPVWTDNDYAKWLEAVAYTLIRRRDEELEKTADASIEIVCNAQQPDGYLNTYYINTDPGKRFTDLMSNHELYCLGHLIEGAAAYYEATGKRKLLDALIRYVDCVDRHIGPEEGKLHGYCGCEMIELALVKLYQVTGEEKHLRLSKYFIDQRGQAPLYFEEEMKRNGNTFYWKDSYFQMQYYQAGKPVRDQHIAEGHAVRAVYLYSGMADIAKLTGDDELLNACNDLWDNIVNRQMYITGSIGQSSYGETFTFDYDLPNDTVYAETCAAIGLAFFAQRLTSINPKGIYADVLEKTLYNGIISGMSLDGRHFFYVNPLEVFPEACEKSMIYKHVDIQRQKWFGCACCPPNLARIVASLGSYVHSLNDNTLYTHLFPASDASVFLAGQEVKIKIETKYPWEGRVDITFALAAKTLFRYGFRLPGWCRQYHILLNGRDIPYTIENGYLLIKREWDNGDSITLDLEMPVTLIEANPKVRQNIGKTAVMRGPVVYCLEEADNGKELFKIHLGDNPDFVCRYEADFLGGVAALYSTGKKQRDWDGDTLYRPAVEGAWDEIKLRWIPYYAWANRTPGEMILWVYK